MAGHHLPLALILALALPSSSPAAAANLSRGIYAHTRVVLGSGVWATRDAVDFPEAAGRTGAAAHAVAQQPGYVGVSQTVNLGQTTPQPVKISGWSKAAGVTEGSQGWQYSLYVDFRYTDGESLFMQLVPFAAGTHDWQYGEVVVTPAKPLQSASFNAFLRQRAGEVWFDDLFLGEIRGPNLLKAPGFEPDQRTDRSQRQALFDTLADLNSNALHTYLPDSQPDWDAPDTTESQVGEFLADAGQHGLGVYLTLGRGLLPMRDARDPNFPQYYCVNGPWGERWAANLAKAARYPFAGISLVPDEYNWNNHHMQQALANHADPEVKAFYEQLGTYCPCPVCQALFGQQTGLTLPDRLPGTLPAASDVWRRYLSFRYDSTTDWLKRTAQAIRASNPRIRLDSLLCVTPICSDYWYGPGIAWDRAGYEAGLQSPTTDPYILLHNYLGDSTHWYVTETTEHLAGASPERHCGIVLEASRLRTEYRELDPVETYGSALSAVWHGADELAWWHLSHITDQSHTTNDAPAAYARVKGAYQLLKQIDGWFDGSRPAPGIAFLFSRASCDWWRFYAQAEGSPAGILGDHGSDDPRYAAMMQKELLYALLRQGYPVTLYYLDSLRADELAAHPVVVAPFCYAIGDQQAAMLRQLAAQKLVLIGDDHGRLDEAGLPRPRPALDAAPGQLRFLPPGFCSGLVTDRSGEVRTRTERIVPPPLDAGRLDTLRRELAGAGVAPLLQRPVDGDDVELAVRLNNRGERLLMMINWRSEPVTAPRLAGFGAPLECWSLDRTGRVSPRELAAGALALDAQEAVVARFAAR